MATEPFMASRDILHKELRTAGVKHDFMTIGNENLITRARNVIASSFLYETDYDNLLFWDSDIEAEPYCCALLYNLCYQGLAHVAAGPYRFKNPASERTAWVDGKLRPVEDFSEPFAVDYAGTGFMMIPRTTFKRLQVAHPEWEYAEGFPLDEGAGEMKCWAFFQDPIEDGFHLSEDYFFCKRVREQNMNVIMHPDIYLKHWGMYAY